MKVLSLFRQMLDAMTYINEQSKLPLMQTKSIGIWSLTISSSMNMGNSKSLISALLEMWKQKWRRESAPLSMLLQRS